MDWINEPAGELFVKSVLDDMAPKMADSACVMSLVPDGEYGSGDVKFWVETGAAIMMDKPIILMLNEGQPVPPKLGKVADKIVRLPNEGLGPEAREVIQKALDEAREEGLIPR